MIDYNTYTNNTDVIASVRYGRHELVTSIFDLLLYFLSGLAAIRTRTP